MIRWRLALLLWAPLIGTTDTNSTAQAPVSSKNSTHKPSPLQTHVSKKNSTVQDVNRSNPTTMPLPGVVHATSKNKTDKAQVKNMTANKTRSKQQKRQPRQNSTQAKTRRKQNHTQDKGKVRPQSRPDLIRTKNSTRPNATKVSVPQVGHTKIANTTDQAKVNNTNAPALGTSAPSTTISTTTSTKGTSAPSTTISTTTSTKAKPTTEAQVKSINTKQANATVQQLPTQPYMTQGEKHAPMRHDHGTKSSNASGEINVSTDSEPVHSSNSTVQQQRDQGHERLPLKVLVLLFIGCLLCLALISSQWWEEFTKKKVQALSGTWRMALATILHGLGTGLIGIFVALLIEWVQIVGFDLDEMSMTEFTKDHPGGFLYVAETAPAFRRFISVLIGGLFGAVAWFWVRGREPSFVPVNACMDGKRMPVGVTTVNAMIQDIVVALGGSFGREAAPREMAAMLGGRLGDGFDLSQNQRKVLVACGTGAGLAAVYSVPISGVFYIIEHVLAWDVSFQTVLPAVTTCCIATVVAGFVVPTDGLYHIHLYSYTWLSPALLSCAVVIGPVAGAVAAFFVRLIAWARTYRPQGRRHVSFPQVVAGDLLLLSIPSGRRCVSRDELALPPSSLHPSAYHPLPTENDSSTNNENVSGQRELLIGLDYSNGNGGSKEPSDIIEADAPKVPRQELLVVEKTAESVVLERRLDGICWKVYASEWDATVPVGPRDTTILMVMPAAFLTLALLSVKFPSLLGNGRALAQVAMFHDIPIGRLVALFFLKAMVTVFAIGAGVDGGTLTPSVALGAVIGATLQSVVPEWWPLGGPPPKEALSVVAAAAFLASAMDCPVTGLWLLMEFSAQAVRREDIVAAMFGDPSGLERSKLGLGMIAPMALAIAGAMWTVKYITTSGLTGVHENILPHLRHSGSNDMDLAPGLVLELNKPTMKVCVAALHWSLRVNACVVAGFGAAAHEGRASPVLLASFLCTLACTFIGAIAGAAASLVLEHSHYQVAPLEEEHGDESSPNDSIRRSGSIDSTGRSIEAPSCLSPQSPALLMGYASACGFCGASVPLAPWALGVGHESGVTLATFLGTLAALIVSAVIAAISDREVLKGGQLAGCMVWQGQVAITGFMILATWCLGLIYVMIWGQL